MSLQPLYYLDAPAHIGEGEFDHAAIHHSDTFHVNISDPDGIVTIRSGQPSCLARTLTIPADGPHGLDMDAKGHILFCSCDSGKQFALVPDSGKLL